MGHANAADAQFAYGEARNGLLYRNYRLVQWAEGDNWVWGPKAREQITTTALFARATTQENAYSI